MVAMHLLSYERESVHKRISAVESELRALHSDPTLSAAQAFSRWQSLYSELKRLRGTPTRFINQSQPVVQVPAALVGKS
jgi:hypothetical protein